MCRIVINPEQLADAARALQTTAGEYQALGAQVASCDCGCMPPDVAAITEAVTASVSASLRSLTADLAGEAGDLAARAGVPQDGGTALVIGGESYTPQASEGVELLITGDTYAPALAGGQGVGLLITSDAYPISPTVGTGFAIGGAPAGANGGGTGLLIYGDQAPPMGGGGVYVDPATGGLIAYGETFGHVTIGNVEPTSAFLTPGVGGGGGNLSITTAGNALPGLPSSPFIPAPGYQRPPYSYPGPA